MTTTTNETQIVSDPEVPLVRITREFDAPAEKVFRAHTDPSSSPGGSAPATPRRGSSTSTAARAGRTAT